MALSVLDEYIAHASREARASAATGGSPGAVTIGSTTAWCGTPTTGACSCSGTKDDAEALREEIAGVLSTMGLRLSPEKTLITHIDEGLDFLGWHIQRRRKRGTSRVQVFLSEGMGGQARS